MRSLPLVLVFQRAFSGRRDSIRAVGVSLHQARSLLELSHAPKLCRVMDQSTDGFPCTGKEICSRGTLAEPKGIDQSVAADADQAIAGAVGGLAQQRQCRAVEDLGFGQLGLMLPTVSRDETLRLLDDYAGRVAQYRE